MNTLIFSTLFTIKFKKSTKKPSVAGNFIFTLLCVWHTCSRWYTPDFQIVTTDG